MILAILGAYFSGAFSTLFVLALCRAASRADERDEVWERFAREGLRPAYKGDE